MLMIIILVSKSIIKLWNYSIIILNIVFVICVLIVENLITNENKSLC